MSTLNISTNGPSINKSYQSIVNAPAPSGPAAQSHTYGQWAIFSVTAPLANAFAQDSVAKESLLKVQSTGEGELADLIDEFSDGRVQFAFVKVKDPNTTLLKSVLIAWCGEGVPERTKGYFTNHMAVVSKTLQGYHVQITARSDRDLTPESIVQKVSDASGSKYSGAANNAVGPPPNTASKPVITPTQSSLPGRGFNPIAAHSRSNVANKEENVDEDGWGHDAPPVTRTQLEKVPSSYQPTTVNLSAASQQPAGSDAGSTTTRPTHHETSDVVRGGYQPVGKIDIAEIRRQAKRDGQDDRPIPVKGSYEPVGKVDIAAIRARAQPPGDTSLAPPNVAERNESDAPIFHGSSLKEDRFSSPSTDGRLTELPKPRVSHRFGANAASFAGTKPPAPSASPLENKPSSAAPQSGVGRTFADQGGKTPAQIWAEKKARERGMSAGKEDKPAAPITAQTSGGGEWKSGYKGKSWAAVQTTRAGNSSGEQQPEPQQDEQPSEETAPAGGFGALRDKFSTGAPIGSANIGRASTPPALDISSKPNAGQGPPQLISQAQAPRTLQGEPQPPAISSPPTQPPRSPTPPTPPAVSGSPIRVAMPIGRGTDESTLVNALEELESAPSFPTQSIAEQLPREEELPDEHTSSATARGTGEAMATTVVDHTAATLAQNGSGTSGRQAQVQYDYEKAEDNEIELREGDMVVEIEMVDENWWMGKNVKGESGLFPSNYVELVENSDPRQDSSVSAGKGTTAPAHTATTLYDYEAAEDNEISFPENVQIADVEFPDEDWWSGVYNGKHGLFPANYVKLDA